MKFSNDIEQLIAAADQHMRNKEYYVAATLYHDLAERFQAIALDFTAMSYHEKSDRADKLSLGIERES